MPVGLYADVHVPGPVLLQLRRRGVDILAATEEGTNELPDDQLLTLATSLRRVLVTQDIRFRVLAEDWQRTGHPFAGLVFAHQRYVSFGEMVGQHKEHAGLSYRDRDERLGCRATSPAWFSTPRSAPWPRRSADRGRVAPRRARLR